MIKETYLAEPGNEGGSWATNNTKKAKRLADHLENTFQPQGKKYQQ